MCTWQASHHEIPSAVTSPACYFSGRNCPPLQSASCFQHSLCLKRHFLVRGWQMSNFQQGRLGSFTLHPPDASHPPTSPQLGPLLWSQSLYANPKCKYDPLCASVLFLNSTGFAALKKRWLSTCKSSWRTSPDSEVIQITHSSLKNVGVFNVRVATYLQYTHQLLALRIYTTIWYLTQ